jgi:enamine deaminase RidA (YjgF/YER057c/UK114 family)
MELLFPKGIAPPASNYSHGVVVPAAARRLIIAGQIGLNPDGSLADGLEAQMERCWLNIFAILKAAGMTKRDLVKISGFVTRDGATARYREIRDRMLEGHAPAATYLVVAGLASPEMLVEIEGEAVAS